MFDHIYTYAKDYPATKAFYEAALSALGYSIQAEFVAEWNQDFPTQRRCGFGNNDKPSYWIIESREAATPRHLAFAAASRRLVDDFYKQAMANGGADNGKPGLRPWYHENYYGAFVIDPDGNNIEAVCHAPA
ncbi:MAG: VOC family protein [Verrucomicrobiota bacterium JB024]|nr:VOC family protein [Verrucomicrobiota bacterium JB024]